mgnify:CR=1 FL=1
MAHSPTLNDREQSIFDRIVSSYDRVKQGQETGSPIASKESNLKYMDSLEKVKFILELEREFEIEFDLTEINRESLNSFKEISILCEKYIS